VRSSSAFGTLRATADASDTYDPEGFGGQQGYYWDYAGLYLLTHRYYDANAGRFLTRDPIGYGGGMNLYGYADGNPVNESDPSGYNPLSRFLGRELSAFEQSAHRAGQLAMEFLEEGAKAKSEYGGLTPAIPEPPIIAGSPDARAAQEENATAPAPPRGPSIAFNRDYHYGRTPTRPQKRSVPRGMLFDHDPPLGQHYYEGDGKGGKPGYQMTQEERLQYARRLDVGKPAVPGQRHGQGGTVKGYTERMRKMHGLPPFRMP